MKAVLDACVLYPTLTRSLLLGLAREGLFTPLWSQRIMGEWMHAAAKTAPQDHLDREAGVLRAQWPDAEVKVPEGSDYGLSLPDPDDTHVLAAAIASGADALITYNLRDFPPRTLARYNLTPWHPDAFVMGFWAEAPDTVLAVLKPVLAPVQAVGIPPRAALKRARLPKLGKAVAERL